MKYIKQIPLLMTALLLLAISTTAIAQDSTAASESPKEEKFDPKPAIFHHIADAHKFDVLEFFSIPLPCILYSSQAGGVSTFMYGEGKEVNGYKCEEGKVTRDDKASFLDMSITKNVFSMLLSAFLLIYIFTIVTKAYTTNKGKAPTGMQSLIEVFFVFIRDEVAKPGIGPRYETFMPYLMTIFFFILANNLLGMIPIFPGGANVTGNISFTLVLAVIAFIIININGTKDYWKHIFWMPGVNVPIKLFMAPIEFAGVLIKPVALMIRLFANMTAGHIIVMSLISLIFVFGNAGHSLAGSGLGMAIAVPFTLFISLIEVLVAFIQPFIFAMLTAVFIGMALEEHPHEEAHH